MYWLEILRDKIATDPIRYEQNFKPFAFGIVMTTGWSMLHGPDDGMKDIWKVSTNCPNWM